VADILVVEDEPVIRAALRRFLERNKFKVSEAASVHEAEGNFQLERFDLIISDLRLPGAPGTDLVQRAGEVPVLIMTSYASLRSTTLPSPSNTTNCSRRSVASSTTARGSPAVVLAQMAPHGAQSRPHPG
jgi:Response regulator receiver domain